MSFGDTIWVDECTDNIHEGCEWCLSWTLGQVRDCTHRRPLWFILGAEENDERLRMVYWCIRIRSLHMHHVSWDLTRPTTLFIIRSGWSGIWVIVLEIVIVREGSSDSLGSSESEIYLHSLKLVLGQCNWIEFVAGYSLNIAYHLVRTTRWQMPWVGTWAMYWEHQGVQRYEVLLSLA